MAGEPGNSPVAEFCAGLRRLQEQSGLDRTALARRLGYSRSQLYEILDGRISRPPEWDRLVEPLVRACTGNDAGAVEIWRRRHGVLVEVYAALRRQTRQGERAPAVAVATPAPLSPCPYRGLSPFREEDGARFFGREELADLLATELERKPVVLLAGPSGCGKSSLIFAGVVPRLRQAGWSVAAVRPSLGSSPLTALAAELSTLLVPDLTGAEHLLEADKLAGALAAPGLADVADRIGTRQGTRRLLLVIDQFEEVYARDAALAEKFLDVLFQPAMLSRHGAKPSVAVALTLRADFLGHALENPQLAQAAQDSTVMIGRMTRTQLRRAIEQPLPEEVRYEPGLVDRILADVGQQAGHLALLEFTLTVLWEQQQDRTLTHREYEDLGGVRGALSGYAEEIYTDELNGAEEAAARLFVQLVRPGDLTGPTRRVARRSELDPSLWPIVQRLAATRLVVTGREDSGAETVELAHEALISGWRRLHRWVAADRDFRNWQERLRNTMRQHEISGRDEGMLLRGVPLAESQRWLADRGADLSTAERDFINASRERQGRAVRRLRALVAALVALLVLAVTLGVSAERQRRHVQRQERLATSQALAARADTITQSRPVESILLTLQAHREADTADARGGVLQQAVRHSSTKGFLTGHTSRVSGVAFSRDGRTLASSSIDGTARLWDPVARRELAVLSGHSGWVRSVAFSPDGGTVATAGDDSTTRLWDVATRRELATLTGHTEAVRSVAFSPDGRFLATGGDRTVRLWDVATRRQLAALNGHTDIVRAVAFGPDSRTLASTSYDRTVRLWDIVARTQLAALNGHTDRVFGLAFSPDGATLASAGTDRTVRLWDVTGRRELAALTGHSDAVTGVAFSRDGSLLASSSADQTIRLWDVAARQVRGTLTGHGNWVTGVTFGPDGRTLVSSSDDVTIRVWDVTARPELAALTGHAGPVGAVALSPEGRLLATGGNDRTVRLWDIEARSQLAVLTGHTDAVRGLAFSPDGRLLASSGADRTVRLWSVAARTQLTVLTGHTDRVWGLSFSPDGRTLASASHDHTIRLWDTTARRQRGILTGHTAWVTAVAFSPDGRSLASASEDDTLRLWDVASGRQRAVLTGHADWVSAVAFSPDGRTVASGSQDETIRLWEPSTGRRRATLTGHDGWVWTVAFSPDGRTLASGSDDATVRLWDVDGGRQLATLAGHRSWVLGVAFSSDGTLLATASQDRTAHLWDMRLTTWQERLCNLAGRNLTREEWQEFLPGRPYRKTCPNHP